MVTTTSAGLEATSTSSRRSFGWLYLVLIFAAVCATLAWNHTMSESLACPTGQQQEDITKSAAANVQEEPANSSNKTKTAPANNLRDLHIALMGDSITRYQYLSLVYYLRYNRWFDPQQRTHQHLVNVRSFASPFHNDRWHEFFFQTNQLLAPAETCDCYRAADSIMSLSHATHSVCEDRYYFDPERKISVTYIQAMGHTATHRGHMDPSLALMTAGHVPITFNSTPYTWEYSKWEDTVRFHVAKLWPKPQFLVLNAGLWNNKFGTDEASRQNLVDTIQDVNITGIWKTTTARRDGSIREQNLDTDVTMCLLLDKCLNLSWTANQLSEADYWDKLHFYEPIYRRINEQMLEMIEELANIYSTR